MTRRFSEQLLLAFCLAAASPAFDLAGTWHVSALDMPNGVTQQKNTPFNTWVVGINGGDEFNITDGTLTISPSGAVSGFVGETVAGTASVTADGAVTLSLTSPEVMSLGLTITAGSDLMATAHGASDYNELLVMAKAPQDTALSDVVGNWWLVELDAPPSFGIRTNNQGYVTNVDNANSFKQKRSLLAIDAQGNFNYNSGEATGSVSVSASGEVTVTPTPTPEEPNSSPIPFHLNARKDVMITAIDETDVKELMVLVKTHEVKNWEAAGHWTMSSEEMPGSLYVSYDNQHRATNISGLDSFHHRNGYINFTLEGPLSGHLEQDFQGYTAGSSNGLLSIYHGEPNPFYAAISSSGDFFAGVGDGNDDREMIIAVRSVRPFVTGIAQAAGGLQVLWVPGAGMVLQESVDGIHWTDVPGSEGQSAYIPTPATDGTHHLYRLRTL